MKNNIKNNNFIKYSSRFYKYFLSYIFLLIIVLSILGVVVYRNFIITMKNEVEKSNILSAMQLRNVMDMSLREMERTAVNISYNNNLKYFKVSDNNYESLEAVRELKKYKSSNEFVYDIALYYNHDENHRIYTTITSTNLNIFFNYVYKYETWSENNFLDIINSLDTPMMYPIGNVLFSNSEKKEMAIYIYPLAINTVKPYITVIFFIEKDVLVDTIKNALGQYSGYVYIIDRQQNPIFCHTNDELERDSLDILNSVKNTISRQNVDSIDIDGRNYSVASITSDYNGWSYIVARRTDQLMSEVNTNRTLFNYVIISVLLLGIIIAFIFAFGNYKPLRKLVEMISNQTGKHTSQMVSDEFEYIIKTIKGVSKENKDLSKQLQSKSTLVKNQFITKLLNKKFNNSKEIENMQDIYGIKFKYPNFVVLVFSLDNYDKLDADNGKGIKDLVTFSIINVTEELSQQIGQGYGVESVDGRAVNLLLNIKDEYIRERYISELAFKTKDFFSKYFDFTMTVGIGNIYNKIELVHESYLEANRAVYYRLVKGYGNVIFYEEIRERQKRVYKYPSKLEEELIMAIKKGKNDEVKKTVTDINKHITDNSMTIEAIQCICFGIINAIMKTLSDINIDTSQCFKDNEEVLFAQPFDTIDNLMDRIVEFCSTICNYVRNQKESKNFELREQIFNMIKHNYRDNSLSLEKIADKLGKSPSYISRYFKDQTGYSLMQYVDMLRMDEVKKLLVETDLTLNDIIQQVGYVDKSSFYRKFKKKEGVTPTQYRNIIKNGKGCKEKHTHDKIATTRNNT